MNKLEKAYIIIAALDNMFENCDAKNKGHLSSALRQDDLCWVACLASLQVCKSIYLQKRAEKYARQSLAVVDDQLRMAIKSLNSQFVEES
jgi:hypothetical protein